MKAHRVHVILLVASSLLFSSFGNQEDTGPLTLATWNIRILSNNSRSDDELDKIAAILSLYDLVAVQEIRDEDVLERLISRMPGYGYICSVPVGGGVKERYAYFFRSEKVQLLGQPYITDDPGDQFFREPFVAHFRSGNFDFTLVTIHIVYGDSVSDRKEEVSSLGSLLLQVDFNNGPEEDLILLGDFNLPPDDPAWQTVPLDFLLPAEIPTTISDTSSYDNIRINRVFTREASEKAFCYFFDELLFDDDRLASLEVSDHRPVFAEFRTDLEDDDTEGDWNQSGELEVALNDCDIRIIEVVSSPAEDESISLQNLETRAMDISGWQIKDKDNSRPYRIPDGTILSPGQSITFSSELPFGINDEGERLILINKEGEYCSVWVDIGQ